MQDVRSQNVTAVSTIANVVKTSLGPKGLDKMLVDDIGDVTITNDGATILRLLEVEQPAAKVGIRHHCISFDMGSAPFNRKTCPASWIG